MPITNQPISTQRTLGEGSAMFGIFTQTMIPGLVLGLIAWASGLWLFEGKHEKAAPAGFAIVIGYWIYVGNDREKAWRNLTRHVNIPSGYIGSSTNRSIIEQYQNAENTISDSPSTEQKRI
jgi:hypothetical protein